MNDTVLLILACAAATYVTRFSGHVILSKFGAIHHRVSAALDAVPTAVIAALVAPSLVTHGAAETLAVLLAALTALRLPLMFGVLVGLLALVALRLALG